MSRTNSTNGVPLHVLLDRLSSFVYRNATDVYVASPPGMTVIGALERVLDAVRLDHFVAEAVLPTQRSYLLSNVSIDVLLTIFSFIGTEEDMLNVEMTSSGLHKLVRGSDLLWNSVCRATFPRWYDRALALQVARPVHVVPGKCMWREMFRQKKISERCWLAQRTPPSERLQFPRGVHCIYHDRDELLIGSGSNNEIHVLDLKQGRLKASTTTEGTLIPGLHGHTQVVTCLEAHPQDSSLLFSGSHDMTLRAWDRSVMAPKLEFRGHAEKVWCLDVCGPRLFSGSGDRSVKIWDIETAEEVATLNEHRTTISTLKIMNGTNGSVMVTGSAGNTVRMWQIADSTAVCTAKLRGHQKGVFGLHVTPSLIISGSLDNTIRLWDPRCDNKLISTLVEIDRNGFVLEETGAESTRGYVTLAADDTKVVAGGPEKVVHIWDYRMNRLVQKLHGHEHWVTAVAFDDNKLITGSRDKSIRIWDVNRAHDHICRDIPSNIML